MRTPTTVGGAVAVQATTLVTTASKVRVGVGRYASGTMVVGSSQTLTVSW